MADAYTSQGLTKPEPGGSLNTWGSKLNVVFDMLAAMLKAATVSCTSGATLAFGNADSSATALPFLLRLGGSPTAAFTVTMPAVDKYWMVRNGTNYTATIKVSGGTGITLPSGYTALVMYDTTQGDIVNVSPTYLPGAVTILGALAVAGKITGVTNGTDPSDAVTKSQLDAAIAAAGTLGDGTFFVSATDTTRKFLAQSLTTQISGALSLAIDTVNAGANEQARLTGSVGVLALTAGSRQTASFTAASNTFYPVAWAANGTVTLPSSPADGDVIGFAYFYTSAGYTTSYAPNGKKVNGSTSTLNAGVRLGVEFLRYDATLGDWT